MTLPPRPMSADALEKLAYDHGLFIVVQGDRMFVRHNGRDHWAVLPPVDAAVAS